MVCKILSFKLVQEDTEAGEVLSAVLGPTCSKRTIPISSGILVRLDRDGLEGRGTKA